MTTIVDSIRKHQKSIVLVFAVTVVALYMIPLDQLAHAGPKADAIKAKLQKVIDKLNARGLTNAASHVQDAQYRIVAHLESKGL